MRKLVLSTLVLALVAAPAAVRAQGTSNTSSDVVNVSAVVVQGIKITVQGSATLSFNPVIPGGAATIVAPTSGVALKVDGEGSLPFNLTWSMSTAMPAGLTYVPSVSAFNANTPGSAVAITTPASLTLSGSRGAVGSYYVWVGGSMTAAAGTAANTYAGVLTMTATYN